MEIRIERAKTLKPKPDQNHLGFGKYYTDHMFEPQWFYIMLRKHSKV